MSHNAVGLLLLAVVLLNVFSCGLNLGVAIARKQD